MKIMKIKSISIVVLIAWTFSVQAHEGRITVHVTDESGIAVSNAETVVQFENILPPGEGWGSGRPTEAKGLTDTNGNCTITASSTGGSVSVGVRKDGYYYGNAEAIFTNGDLILNRWLPWNPTVEVLLKQKGVQAPMYARRVKEIKVPVEGKPVGFDLTAGDWVAPYGKGATADFLFQLERKPEPEVPAREIPPYDVTLTVSFPNDGDGIQSVFVPPQVHSGLRLPRQAPFDGYEPVLVKHRYKERGQPEHPDFREDQNYFFRVRTKKDAQGNIVSALYGKIDGDFRGGIAGKITFTYYLNPTPNSQNMEFDPKQNLMKNLKSLEGVDAP
jgi:hypothetical protein